MMNDLPRYRDLLKPALCALDAAGGSASIDELDDAVAAAMGLSTDQLAVIYSSGNGLVVADRLSWARTYLRKAGLIDSGGRGIWVLTDRGREARTWPESEIKRFVADEFRKQQADRKQVRVSDEPGDEANPEAPIVDWRDTLLAELKAMEPAAFERLSQRLLRESGFVKVEVTGRVGDGGIDGAGVLRMNLISFQVLFQCKRYAGSVGAGAVRDFRGAMQGRADKGLIITTGTFTPDARREATRDGAPAIDLIDGEAMCDLLKDLKLGVTVTPVVTERIDIDPAFFASL